MDVPQVLFRVGGTTGGRKASPSLPTSRRQPPPPHDVCPGQRGRLGLPPSPTTTATTAAQLPAVPLIPLTISTSPSGRTNPRGSNACGVTTRRCGTITHGSRIITRGGTSYGVTTDVVRCVNTRRIGSSNVQRGSSSSFSYSPVFAAPGVNTSNATTFSGANAGSWALGASSSAIRTACRDIDT